MGCLFGYYGLYDPTLLEKMAAKLSHRCHKGWEHEVLNFKNDQALAIGRGIPPWTKGSNITVSASKKEMMGYAGLIFNSSKVKGTPSFSANTDNLEGAFVLAAGSSSGCTLVRDCAGIKALYYSQTPNRLLFASEIKALFADSDIRKELRIAAIPEFLTFSYIPGQHTMFKGVYELEPGTKLFYNSGNLKTKRYFNFEQYENTQAVLSPFEYIKNLKESLETSVLECLNALPESPVVFLSGGIDSSSVLALAARQKPDERIKTFSINFGSQYPNENVFVEMMVKHCRTEHFDIEVHPKKFLRQMREIIYYLDDPIGDPITVPNYLIAQTASRFGHLVLNGEGGDPCFGGPKNIPMMLAQLYQTNPHSSTWVAQNYLRSYRKCYDDLSQILHPDVIKDSGGKEVLEQIVDPFFKTNTPENFLNKLMSINIRLKGGNLILVKVDKMTSANGIIALPPLFSKRLIEYSMKCPPQLKLNGSVEKNILKLAVKDIVPMEIVNRPKSGMMVPVRFWFRKEMKKYAKKVLSRKNIRKMGYFNPEYVDQLLKYNLADLQSPRYGLKLWMLITFMLWHERMVEN